MGALGLALFVGAAVAAVPNEPTGDAAEELVHLLGTTKIRARVDEALAERYADRDAEGWADVALDENEVWPAVMGDASFLLEGDRWKDVCRECRRLRDPAAPPRGPLARLVLHQKLWTAFDHLFLDGANPERQSRLDAGRQQAVLYELAQTMRHIALTREEIAALPSGAAARDALLGGIPRDQVAEIYSLQGLPLHDGVVRYRMYSRIYCYDAGRDLQAADRDELVDLVTNGWRMPVGSRAVLARDILTVTADGVLYPTDVSFSLSSYTIEGAGEEDRAQYFAYAALDPGTGGCAFDDYVPYPDTGEAWSSLNLPSVPPVPGIGRRVPVWESCADCHGGSTMGLSFTIKPRDTELLRIVPLDGRADGDYLRERIVTSKRDTAEFIALSAYMEMDENSGARLVATAGAGPSLLGSGTTALLRLGVLVVVLLGGLALGARLARPARTAAY